MSCCSEPPTCKLGLMEVAVNGGQTRSSGSLKTASPAMMTHLPADTDQRTRMHSVALLSNALGQTLESLLREPLARLSGSGTTMLISTRPTLRNGIRAVSLTDGTGLSCGRQSYLRAPIDSSRWAVTVWSVLRVLGIRRPAGVGGCRPFAVGVPAQPMQNLRRFALCTEVGQRLSARQRYLECGGFGNNDIKDGVTVQVAQFLLVRSVNDESPVRSRDQMAQQLKARVELPCVLDSLMDHANPWVPKSSGGTGTTT